MKTGILGLIALAINAVVAKECNMGWCHLGLVNEPEVATTKLTFAVKLQNEDALEAYLNKVSDPSHEMYGQYMTLEEVNALTSVPESAEALVNWLSYHGIAGEASPGKDFVVAEVSAADAMNIFNVNSMSTYQHEVHGGLIHRASVLRPVIPEQIAGHVDFMHGLFELPSDVTGMPSIAHPELSMSSYLRAQAALTDDATTIAVLKKTYAISEASSIAPGNSLSVIEAIGQQYSDDDLDQFLKQNGLGPQKVARVVGKNDGSQCKINPNTCGEANLDVQYAMGIAENVPFTYWSIDANDQTPFLDWIVAVAADANPPLVHSISYGQVENGGQSGTMTRINTEFMKIGVRGVTITVSSGDDGIAGAPARQGKQYCGFNPSFPASSPYVLSVGATQFKGGLSGAEEIGQSSDNVPSGGITTGGGFSTLFDTPSYQSNVVADYISSSAAPNVPHTGGLFPAKGFNAKGRGYPDVSALGHKYPVVLGGNTYAVDGTSASSPVVAAMLALVNNERLLAGKPTLGFVNPLVYKLAAADSSLFTDVTTGNNRCAAGGQGGAICCDAGFSATTGWDPIGGLGTFNLDKFSKAAMN